MPAPIVRTLQVPLLCPVPCDEVGEAEADPAAQTADGTPRHLITFLYIQVTSFNGRFFWVRLSESPQDGALRPPPSGFGACSVAVPSVAAQVAATLLLDVGASSLRQQERGEAPLSTQAAAFSLSFSERLVRRVQKDCQCSVSVYTSCAIEGEREVFFLGTEGGTVFPPAMAFSATAFKESLALIKELCT